MAATPGKPASGPGAFDPEREGPAFAEKLTAWFRAEGRDYPWRRTRDPYAILVSELMLQQTQIATVLGHGYYGRWLAAFPDVAALAAASEDALLKAWEGLGYYNRARNLQRAARAIVEDHGGHFPRSVEGLLALPGVGRYTAGAVASFAFDLPAPLVDGNVARVFSRVFDLQEPIDAPAAQKRLWHWAEALVPETEARAYNNGLMELGQRICTNAAPACGECPVASHCRTREPGTLPIKKATRKTVQVTERVAWIAEHGRVYLERETGSRRNGLWKLPALRSRTPLPPLLGKWKYGITHHRVDLLAYRATPADCERAGQGDWIETGAPLADLAMASPHRRALEDLLEREDFRLT